MLGHVFLQPGDWGRFKGLPVRKDVADALIDQGITVLRYGGSMINHPQYRWKEMIGPRDRRPTHAGTWYPYSTNGWGIFDFLNFCEAAGFVAIPDVNTGESPQDMADFIEYVNGPADSPWGRKRVGRRPPESLRSQTPRTRQRGGRQRGLLGEVPAHRRGRLGQGPRDHPRSSATSPTTRSSRTRTSSRRGGREVAGRPPQDPRAGPGEGREVWFDIHVWTDHPPEPHGLRVERSYIEQLGKLAPGAKYKVVIFEYNSGNHAMKRALSNALATNEAERVGDLLPIACAANCLQPDGQNDNGWDQGLLFLDPAKAWLQPPGSLIQMTRRHFQPLLVRGEIRGRAEKLSVNAKRAEDGKTLVLQVVNWGDEPRPSRIEVEGFSPSRPLGDGRTSRRPARGRQHDGRVPDGSPERSDWMHQIGGGKSSYTFPPRSITIIRLE